MAEKIILFVHARSGSSTLTHVLNLHPKVNLCFEPFNKDYYKWSKTLFKAGKNYKKETITIEDLDNALDDIHKSYNGLKTGFHELPEDLTRHLLLNKGYKVIFLYRKNLLKTAISEFIAHKTKIWQHEQKKFGYPELFDPIDPKELKSRIAITRRYIDSYLEVLEKSDVPFLVLSYEELYADSLDERIEKIEDICTFLELEFPKFKARKMKKLLSPQRKTLNTEIYNCIPNIRDIERQLGSKENGFIFQD